MKKTQILLLALILVSGSAINAAAQNINGTVQYESTIALGVINLESLPQDVAALMPKESKSNNVLYFSAVSSLYENVVEDSKATSDFSATGSNTDINISIQTGSREEKVYVDIANQKIVEQKDLMGKRFLITDKLGKQKWKMTGRQKMLLDYPMQEAIFINEKDTILAWYTSAIPVSTGPMGIAGLPGLVLEASIGNRTTIRATKIDFEEKANTKIKEPTKGKKVTKEEFEKIAKEKAEEMRQQRGANGSNVEYKIITR